MNAPWSAGAGRVSWAALADLADVSASSVHLRRADGGNLHVLDYGGAGRPTIVLPGITSPAISLDFVAQRLAGHVRPIVVDLRGRGLSDDADDWSLASYTSDLRSVVDQMSLAKPIIVGHSLGARIAAAYGVEATTSPLVLVEPPLSTPTRPYPTSLSTFLDTWDNACAGTTADALRASRPRWPWRELELRARWLSSVSRASIIGTHAGFETETFEPYWEMLDRSDVFLLYGADSPVVTVADAERLAAQQITATLHLVPEAGHMLYWDSPRDAIQLTQTVISQLVD